MKTKIIETLQKFEEENEIKIIYAVESGSRAWGFSSPDSDYDIRFLYVHKPQWYFSVLTKPDNLNLMDKDNDLDFSGWDIKKTLNLLLKSNMSLYEWFNSHIVYIDSPQAQQLKDLAIKFWSKTSFIFSYAALARNNYKNYILGKQKVRAKKYLYIFRTLAACLWIEHKKTFPPIEINKLLSMLENENKTVSSFLSDLISIKKQGTELGIIEPKKEINSWIEKKIEYYLTSSNNNYEKPQKNILLLDKFFYEVTSSLDDFK
jgi:predicted nucleotidyltransferase